MTEVIDLSCEKKRWYFCCFDVKLMVYDRDNDDILNFLDLWGIKVLRRIKNHKFFRHKPADGDPRGIFFTRPWAKIDFNRKPFDLLIDNRQPKLLISFSKATRITQTGAFYWFPIKIWWSDQYPKNLIRNLPKIHRQFYIIKYLISIHLQEEMCNNSGFA